MKKNITSRAVTPASIFNSESRTCTNFTFGDNCLRCKMINRHTKMFLFKRFLKYVILLQLLLFIYLILKCLDINFATLTEIVKWCLPLLIWSYNVDWVHNIQHYEYIDRWIQLYMFLITVIYCQLIVHICFALYMVTS